MYYLFMDKKICIMVRTLFKFPELIMIKKNSKFCCNTLNKNSMYGEKGLLISTLHGSFYSWISLDIYHKILFNVIYEMSYLLKDTKKSIFKTSRSFLMNIWKKWTIDYINIELTHKDPYFLMPLFCIISLHTRYKELCEK